MRIHDPENLTYPQWFGIVFLLVLFAVFLCNWLNMTIWNY